MTHVLIVEDQAMVRKLLESYVEKEPDLKAMAVTQNGVTVTPTQLIVDKYIAYLTFSVTG